MTHTNIVLPSKPKIIKEEGNFGIYEIDGLYPGYGHTLGNSLRRIILSSLSGAAITSVKIAGVSHEFSTIEGVKEDVITILLNLKKLRIKLQGEEGQVITLNKKGAGEITAKDLELPSQVELLTPELPIATITSKSTELSIEMRVEKGLGYVPKEIVSKDRVEIGSIALDAIFSPIRKVSYEVEDMRVGDKTNFNRLRVVIDTDGTISPKEALEESIKIMIAQLKAIVGFADDVVEEKAPVAVDAPKKEEKKELDSELLKTRIESLDLSPRTINALNNSNIRTLGGLARKREADLLGVDGLGEKSIVEIRKVLAEFGITLK
jgi:DNA-directed RNA polymerase subunit alpha